MPGGRENFVAGGPGIGARGLRTRRMEAILPPEKSAYEIQRDENVARVREAAAPVIAAREDL